MDRDRRAGKMCAEISLRLIAIAIFALISSSQALDDIYSAGQYDVHVFDVAEAPGFKNPKCKKTAGDNKPVTALPPRPLHVAVPIQSGVYPIVHLQHGFFMENKFYTQLMRHVGSYGYIVIVPQMPQFASVDATKEIAQAADLLDWYPNNLAALIAKNMPQFQITPDLNKLVLAGHSRGGKVAFGLATGVCKTVINFRGIAGLDPVDGTGPDNQTPPPILPNVRYGLNLPVPTLIVGAGLGSQRRGFLPPCAPLSVSHDGFFNDSGPLAYYFVAPDYGHMDYLDDKLSGPFGALAESTCKNGPSREPMRQFTGGIVVAFLKATLFGNTDAIDRALANIPSAAPVTLQTPEVTRRVSALHSQQ